MNLHKTIIIATIVLIVNVVTVYASPENQYKYFNIVDETGSIVYQTGWNIKVGDQFIAENNKRYEIVAINEGQAEAKFIGMMTTSAANEEPSKSQFSNLFNWLPVINAQEKPTVAIYHTHDDESYVPTDGKESIAGAGGILKVGEVFTNALKEKGINAIHSENKHDPHDDMAYERSRRTVMELMKQNPAAIFDVHRDAVPPEVYRGNIGGQEISKVQLVVGKYGPTGKQIEDYAIQIKNNADNKYPGLIKGIFFAKGGDYNQDIHPRSMLLEVGAHTNDRQSAEKGVALFADVVPSVLGGTPPANQAGNANAANVSTTGVTGTSKSIIWIIAFAVLGTILFLFLSTGSMNEAKAKLKQFTTTEFANFLGNIRKRKK